MADTRSDSNDHTKTPVNKSGKPIKAKKPIAPIRQRLMLTWLIWLAYRLLGLPILISVFNPAAPIFLAVLRGKHYG